MRAANIAAAENANSGTDQLAGRFSAERPVGRLFPEAMRIMHGLFQRKPASEIAARTGAGVRAAERWLAGTREMGAEQLLSFIVSDRGADFIAALVNDLPRNRRLIFWARIDRAARRALKEERISRLKEEIEQLDLLKR